LLHGFGIRSPSYSEAATKFSFLLQATGQQSLMARVEGIRGSRFPLYPELTLSLPRLFIRRKLIEFEPDLIHVADPTRLGLAGIYYSDVLGLPLVASYHSRLPKYLRYYRLSALEPAVWKLMQLRHNKA
jgi:hypothetical protein